MLRIITLSATLFLCLVSGGGFSQTFSVNLEAKKYASGSNIRCNGGSDGEIQVRLEGGIAPITFLWNDGQSGSQRTGLSAGTYWVTATDSSGNLAMDTLVLIEPPPMQAETEKKSYSDQFQTSQAAAADGQMVVNVLGGSAPYSVVWSDSSFGMSKLNLAPGQYAYTVTDVNGCSLAKQESIQGPPALSVQIQILSEVSCVESQDGKAQAIVSGGVPPYFIQWSSGETDSIAEALDGIRAFVKVSDRQGAETMLPVAFTVPPKLSESVTVSQYPGGYQVSCADCYNGTIDVEVNGGTPPYSIVWPDTSTLANPFSRQNLGGRFYSYTISDANLCKVKGFVELTEPKRRGWQLSGNTEINANEQYLGTNDSSSFVVKTNATLALKIDAEGKVGLGTEPNAARLNVAGDVEGSGGLKLPNLNQFNDTNLQAMQNLRLVAMQDDGTLLKLGTQFPVADLYPGQACKLTQDGAYVSQWKYQAGNPSLATIGTTNCWPFVGIGTENPFTRLHVNGYTYISQGIQIGGIFNSGSAFRVSETGIVSIGDAASPGVLEENANSLLKVYGLISARKVIVTKLDFADYVFDKDYKLPSFPELRKYIRTNNALPGMPTQKQINEQGYIDLHHTQVKHLEKTEELYLYVLQLEERIRSMESQLKNNEN